MYNRSRLRKLHRNGHVPFERCFPRFLGRNRGVRILEDHQVLRLRRHGNLLLCASTDTTPTTFNVRLQLYELALLSLSLRLLATPAQTLPRHQRFLCHLADMPSPTLHILCTLLVSWSFIAGAVISNVTIDDAHQYIVYRPPGGWSVGLGQWDIDPTQLFDRTWHQALSSQGENVSPSVEFKFTGVAVYIYNVVINPTFIQFQLDNESPTTYHSRMLGPGVHYNVLVYSNQGLENKPHTLTMTSSNENAPNLFFDHLVVTTQQEVQISVLPSQHGTTTTIIGTMEPGANSTSLPKESPTPSNRFPPFSPVSTVLPKESPSPSNRFPSFSPVSTVFPQLSTVSSQSVFPTQHSSMPSSILPPQNRSASPSQPTMRAVDLPVVPPNKHTEIAVGGAVGGVAILLLLGVSTILCRRRAQSARERTARLRQTCSHIPESSDALDAPELPPTYSLARAPSDCSSKRRYTALTGPQSSSSSAPLTPSQLSAVCDGPTALSQHGAPPYRFSHVMFSLESLRGQPPSSVPSSLSFVPNERGMVLQGKADPEPEAAGRDDHSDDDGTSMQFRAQLSALQLELKWLRSKQRQMHSVLLDVPPRYEEA